MRHGELLDLLSDLKHDLGKYIRLPFTMLPPCADWDEVRTALHHALLQTRSGPDGFVPARDVWKRFLDEAGGCFESYAAWKAVVAAVDAALAWEKALQDDAPIEREAVERDLAAVTVALQRLSMEVAADE